MLLNLFLHVLGGRPDRAALIRVQLEPSSAWTLASCSSSSAVQACRFTSGLHALCQLGMCCTQACAC